MHQEAVDVVHLQVVERLLECLGHVVGVVVVVPDLGGDKELLARHVASLDGSTDVFLGSITALY